MGRWQNSSSELVRFKSEKTQEIPPLYTHLNGLLDLFSLSLGKSTLLQQRDIKIAARFTYVYDPMDYISEDSVLVQPNKNNEDDAEDNEFEDFEDGSIKNQTSSSNSSSATAKSANGSNDGNDALSGADRWKSLIYQANDKNPLYLLDFGSILDPVGLLYVSCQWHPFSEKELHKINSDLQIEEAHKWSIRCSIDFGNGELGQNLKTFSEMYMLARKEQTDADDLHSEETFNLVKKLVPFARNSELLVGDDNTSNSRSSSASQSSTSLGKQASSNQGINSYYNQTSSSSLNLNDAQIANLYQSLKAVFSFKVEPILERDMDLPKSFARAGSLLSLLAVQGVFLGDWQRIKILWRHFVQMIRDHWESVKTIPHVIGKANEQSQFIPDWSTLLIEQKLVMVSVLVNKFFCFCRLF